VELLLSRGADPNHPGTAETALQTLVYSIVHSDFSDDIDMEILEVLLNSGAEVNAVGKDEAIISRIRCELGDKDKDVIDEAIRSRGKEYYYLTPLRMVEDKLEAISTTTSTGLKESLEDIRDLLISNGAESLHLPPGVARLTVES
jgi:hypothetical protein